MNALLKTLLSSAARKAQVAGSAAVVSEAGLLVAHNGFELRDLVASIVTGLAAIGIVYVIPNAGTPAA